MFYRAQLFEGRSALNPGFFFLLIKNVSLDNFLSYFKSVQSSTCWQKEAGSRVRFSTWKEEKPCSPGTKEIFMSRASKVSPPSKLKMCTGSVCVLLTSVSLKLKKIKIKLIYATTSS